MAANGIIEGNKRLDILEQVQKNRTLVNLQLPRKNYEQLTIITDIKKIKKDHFFLIDPPKGFKEKIAETKSWKIHFRFNGPDKIDYTFETSEGEIIENEIWIKIPGFIERIQRRKHFRMEAPLGTKMFCLIQKEKRELDIINISLGGALVVPVRLKKELSTVPILKENEKLTNLEIHYTNKKKSIKIKIEEIKVRRVEQHPESKIYRYGLELMKINRKEEKKLTDMIYMFQRNFLRNR